MFYKLITRYIFKNPKPSNREADAANLQPADIQASFSEAEWDALELPDGGHSDAKEAFLQNLFIKDRKQKMAVQLYSYGAVMIIVAIAVAMFLFNNEASVNSPASTKNATSEGQYAVNKNSSQQNSIVTLPDESVVTLSPGSEIKYIQDFGTKDRDIYVTGEVLCKVQKNSSHPFTVYCGNVVTTALGTTFRVAEKPGDGTIAVTLLEGKVAVHTKENNSKKNYYLRPGNCICFNVATQQFKLFKNEEQYAKTTVQSPANIIEDNYQPSTGQRSSTETEIAAAQKEKLHFKNAPLSKVLDDLALTYHVEIIYPTKKVQNINFIGEVSKEGSLEKTLADLALMNDFKLIIDSSHRKYMLQ